ncbi:uncharacterized protein LOC144177765 [Haemaphysalis longicornis]
MCYLCACADNNLNRKRLDTRVCHVVDCDVEQRPSRDFSEIFNLDDAIQRYAKNQAKIRGLRLDWVECWYNNSFMKSKPVLKPYQLRVRPGKFELLDVNTETQNPEVVYTSTIKNEGDDDITATIKESREVMETKTITTTRGLEFNVSGSSTATVKGAVGIGGGFSANFMVHRTETNSNFTKKTIDIEMKVTVRPKREVRVVWKVTRIRKDYNWTMDVYLTGYCALYYDRTWNGDRLQIIPVKFLGYEPTIPELQLESPKHSGIVKYRTSGVMTSVETLKHNIVVTEKKISGTTKNLKKPGKKVG